VDRYGRRTTEDVRHDKRATPAHRYGRASAVAAGSDGGTVSKWK
jgi:hypothetical protein